MPNILLTGFEPFGGESINPSWEAVKQLDRASIEGHNVVSRLIPVAFGTSIDLLKKSIEELNPAIVIAVGQAGGRSAISVERVAINVSDGRIPDNEGRQPVDEPINPNGPVAYWSTLPIKAVVKAIREEGIPAEISQTAGTYVCNHLFYGLMDSLASRRDIRGGFIHIPFIPEQAVRHSGQPSLGLRDIIKAIEIAVRTTLTYEADIEAIGGSIH
ncbi:pyroglutamyl-peptidase I [Pullulanibacillus sp. KACC 23026]|uniref:pyroglutamyl-peptidase I n=1 Tax=Pullulanibacillus sp. KACC 23026 TaxID=3028315 RepID=UPI0023AF66EA|nr:pyroglutamyl-peptidase I [Pullulanibacillus sp. KACC 23026]WEG12965.1 pyroglutamyl-peptidase I [Pullulanibacillus sp. KACC 23026]